MIKNYEQLHEITDEKKVKLLVEAILLGDKITPIVVVEDRDISITGVHRIEAYRIVNEEKDIDIPVIEISEELFQEAVLKAGYEYFSDISDMDIYCKALYEISDSEELKDALSDQF